MLTFHPMGISKQDFCCRPSDRMHIELFRHRVRRNWMLTMEQRIATKGWPQWQETQRCELDVETLGEALCLAAKILRSTICLEGAE